MNPEGVGKEGEYNQDTMYRILKEIIKVLKVKGPVFPEEGWYCECL